MIRSKLRPMQERRWLRVLRTLNEFQARLFLANQALDQGRGGISRISALTGVSRTTLTKAAAELTGRKKLEPGVGESGRPEPDGGKQKKATSNCEGN